MAIPKAKNTHNTSHPPVVELRERGDKQAAGLLRTLLELNGQVIDGHCIRPLAGRQRWLCQGHRGGDAQGSCIQGGRGLEQGPVGGEAAWAVLAMSMPAKRMVYQALCASHSG